MKKRKIKDKDSDTIQVNMPNNRGNDIQDSGQETNWDPGEYHLNQQIEMKYLLKRKTNRLNKKEGKAWNEWIDNRIPNLHMEMMTGKEPTGQAGIGQELLDKTRMMMMKQEQDDEVAINQFWKDRGQCEPVPYSISSWPRDLKRKALKSPKVKVRNKFNLMNSCPPQHEVTQDTGLVGRVDSGVSDLQSHCQYEDEGEVKDRKGQGRKKKRENNKRKGMEKQGEKKKEKNNKRKELENTEGNNSDFPTGICVVAGTTPI